MQSLHSLQLLALTALALAVAVSSARRCQVTHPPVRPGAPWTTVYETCADGNEYCFRGRLTAAGETAIRSFFGWPAHRGQLLRACVESPDPPFEEMWAWYETSSLRVCETDGCNS